MGEKGKINILSLFENKKTKRIFESMKLKNFYSNLPKSFLYTFTPPVKIDYTKHPKNYRDNA